MRKIESKLPGVFILGPTVHHDQRGHFFEVYHREKMRHELGIDHNVVQINRSMSHRGVLRGLHYQRLQPQAKMVRVISGMILDVVVDIRPNSPTFKQHVMIEIDSSTDQSIYIPAGYAHGFMVLSTTAMVEYTCDNYYSGLDDQRGVRWNDPDLNIDWPTIKRHGTKYPILSRQDTMLPRLRDIPLDFLPTINALHK